MGRTRGKPGLGAFTPQKGITGYTNPGSPRVSLCSVDRAFPEEWFDVVCIEKQAEFLTAIQPEPCSPSALQPQSVFALGGHPHTFTFSTRSLCVTWGHMTIEIARYDWLRSYLCK